MENSLWNKTQQIGSTLHLPDSWHNKGNYPNDVGTPTADLLLVKTHLNSEQRYINTQRKIHDTGHWKFLPGHTNAKIWIRPAQTGRHPQRSDWQVSPMQDHHSWWIDLCQSGERNVRTTTSRFVGTRIVGEVIKGAWLHTKQNCTKSMETWNQRYNLHPCCWQGCRALD